MGRAGDREHQPDRDSPEAGIHLKEEGVMATRREVVRKEGCAALSSSRSPHFAPETS